MACITTVNFVVMINGLLSRLFWASRELRQGCDLSPLLFLLVMDFLSRLVENTGERGHIHNIDISSYNPITHLIFVDDLLFEGAAKFDEWSCVHSLMSTFSVTSGLDINNTKSYLLHGEGEETIIRVICSLFNIVSSPLALGFVYLDFCIKPNKSLVQDLD